MSSALYLIASFYPSPSHQQSLRNELEQLVQSSRRDAGCEWFDLVQSENEDSALAPLLILEKWRDKAAWEAHMLQPHVQRIGGLDPAHFTQPIHLEFLRAADFARALSA